MKKYKLKTCPFCGYEAELVSSNLGLYNSDRVVQCTYCKCGTALTGNDEKQAVTEWNKRKDDEYELESERYDRQRYIEKLIHTMSDTTSIASIVRKKCREFGLNTTWEHECQIAENIVSFLLTTDK